MIRNWLIRLLRWLVGESEQPSSPPQPSAPARAPLVVALEGHQQALQALDADPQMLLPALLARDRVKVTWQQAQPVPADQAQRLIALDTRLREGVVPLALDDLPAWRYYRAVPAEPDLGDDHATE